MMTHLALLVIAAFVILDDRLYLRLSTSGAGLVRIMDFAVCAAALAAVALSRKGILTRFARNRNLQCCLPYLALGILLPLMGVISGNYPWRTLFTAIVSIRACAVVALGIWLGQQPRAGTTMARWMAACIVLEGFIAACQFVSFQGLLDTSFLRWLNQWDIQTMTDYKDAYLVTGRSAGTFLSANSLGVWSVIAVWFSDSVLTGPGRLLCTASALLSLLLSQSRGSIAAFVVGLVIAALFLPRLKKRAWIGLVATASIALCLGLLAITGGTGAGDSLQIDQMQSRLVTGFAVLSQGASADGNAESRVEAWQGALPFFDDHPLGTWGEPQFLLSEYAIIDNQYVHTLLQGSFPLVAALFLALYAGLRATQNAGVRSFLALTTVGIAVNGISATPFFYSSIGIYWLALGYSTARPRGELVAVGPPHLLLVHEDTPVPTTA